MIESRKPPTEQELLERLTAGSFRLGPIHFEVASPELRATADPNWDLLINGLWQDQQVRFAVDCKARATPKVFDETVRRVRATPLPEDAVPLIVLPYLREPQLEELERRGISGVDLCGNGVVTVPGRLSVYRSGAPNQFPSYAPIKNIYRRNTSMVGRALLVCPVFDSVRELRDAVNAKNLLVSCWGQTSMGMGTVSKALKGLEDDLIIDRSEGIRLLQADRLLDKLQENYEPPRPARRVRLKVDADGVGLTELVREQADEAKLPVMATGLSSVSKYAVMPRDQVLSIYCPRTAVLQERLRGEESSRFPNLELIETDDQPLYFDARPDDCFTWASPTQTYLELMGGDKRDRDTASQLRDHLLDRAAGSKR